MKKAVVSFGVATFLLLVGSLAMPTDIFGSDAGTGAVGTAWDWNFAKKSQDSTIGSCVMR